MVLQGGREWSVASGRSSSRGGWRGRVEEGADKITLSPKASSTKEKGRKRVEKTGVKITSRNSRALR